MSKIAYCCCGSLRAEVSGHPDLVAACHCEQCQRRTGSAFGISAYFPKDQVRTAGPSRVFSRAGQEGRTIQAHFCPECGTTLYWEADFMPGHIGIAAGTFFDPDFPAPTVSAWERSKHPWVNLGQKVLHLQEQRPPLWLPLGVALLCLRWAGRLALSRWILLTLLQWVSPPRRPMKGLDKP
jgi:hypothetical protein